jgi:hypothetical protein
MKEYFTRIGQTLWRSAACHAVPAGRQELADALNFVNEPTMSQQVAD